EAATGRPFVRYWLHNGSLLVGGEKMSKSKGNFVTVGDALKRYGAALLRFFVINNHYRSPMDYSEAALESARGAWNRLEIADANAERCLKLPRTDGASAEGETLARRTGELRAEFSAA